MAIRLDMAFGGGAETWYRLQSAYALAQAMKRADRISVERVSPMTGSANSPDGDPAVAADQIQAYFPQNPAVATVGRA